MLKSVCIEIVLIGYKSLVSAKNVGPFSGPLSQNISADDLKLNLKQIQVMNQEILQVLLMKKPEGKITRTVSLDRLYMTQKITLKHTGGTDKCPDGVDI